MVPQKTRLSQQPRKNKFIVGDLRNQELARDVVTGMDDVYQLAADMGGAGYIFTGEDYAVGLGTKGTKSLGGCSVPAVYLYSRINID
jgi:nucleoside-diphosphate-sugar epimerase